jgi:cell filamentation protein
VTFDPFGDFEARGYLRNLANEKNYDIVRRLEHSCFVTGLDEAFRQLNKVKELSYSDVLSTHRTLFDAVYPWAGEDRMTTLPDSAVVKGEVQFAHPRDIRAAIDYALRNGQNKAFMADKPGEIMGYLAYGHPFLDGNGRTIMVVHSVLAQRAGFSIEWAATSKTDYLSALTNEIDAPGKGLLDAYLEPFKGKAVAFDQLAAQVVRAPGLDGNVDQADNKVLGKTSDPGVKARYERLQLNRKRT